ncbi:MAG: hypothetical protein ACYC96_10290 [Fimbriimonadaceae bacterium]
MTSKPSLAASSNLMQAEALTWRVRLGDGQPAKLTAILLAAALAGLVGFVVCRSVLIGVVGVAIIVGSTSEFWWGVRYRLDESGASAQSGPSLTKIAWPDVRRLVVNDAGVTLSPLPKDGPTARFRGVFLRPGKLGDAGLMDAILQYGGSSVRSLV